jgi:hypothetical protein
MKRSQLLEHYRVGMFQAHLTYVLQHYLNPWAQQLSSAVAAGTVNPQVDPNRLALIVDDRPTAQLRACVLNTLLMLRLQVRVRYITAEAVLDQARALLADLAPWVEVVAMPVDPGEQTGWMAYNLLFKNAAFWSGLPASQLLVFQSDTLLLEPLDPGLFRYGYLGGSWNPGRYVSEQFPRYSVQGELLDPVWESRVLCRSVPQGCVNGNGGLSIRDRDLMALICSHESSADEMPEDIFFALHLKHYANGFVPSPAVVQRFVCETAFHPEVCGLHASWRYLEGREQAVYYERHLKQLVGLLAAREDPVG